MDNFGTDIKTEATDNQLTIFIGKNFTREVVQAFKEAYLNAKDKVHTYIIDFQKTDYMDSSAIAVMMCMKQDLSTKNIHLVHCNNFIYKTLQLVQFDKVFTIKR
ncbi:STAS domain-containing protein [Endozoicomonas sp. SM1973]|uniref:STAS domain-containing protein n=1 Tax=Spartinivicinus marinus TaxID=2994442 RepID=A0A853I3F5_9GAMM|nr:STAS domain-containing protein [Spartinivicinus marinus]MCX4025300.1 STAS domain-containing protein [Spartinivicinus marinus]NYZ66022.1 STAS domain-containing protein [Spartinivicinus marinus]